VSTSTRGRLAAVAVAAAATSTTARMLRRWPPGGRDRWTRTNHAGRPVTLLEGPAYVLGAAAGSFFSGSRAGVMAVVGAGALGALDDLAGDASSRGLRGHLSALGRGQVTTGAGKVLGLAVTGVLAAALVGADRDPTAVRANRAAAVDVLLGCSVVAGTANLVNLLDLRPGRALKATLLLGAAVSLTGSTAAGASVASASVAVGSAAAALRDDLAGASMLGDTGANAAGALLGVALVERWGRPGQLVALGVLTALTLASERVSFTAVIESTPVLRELDAWGRPSGHPRGEALA
jgi:UDP-N-acetylmuramyl pentapeptide phosphotransferase/UDP-N-acetylglucosamine-1-phosphate transferase